MAGAVLSQAEQRLAKELTRVLWGPLGHFAGGTPEAGIHHQFQSNICRLCEAMVAAGEIVEDQSKPSFYFPVNAVRPRPEPMIADASTLTLLIEAFADNIDWLPYEGSWEDIDVQPADSTLFDSFEATGWVEQSETGGLRWSEKMADVFKRFGDWEPERDQYDLYGAARGKGRGYAQ